MAEKLVGATFNISYCHFSNCFDELIVQYDIIEIHDEEIEILFMLEIVTTCFIEGVLRTQNVIDQVQRDETVVYCLHWVYLDLLRVGI